MANRATHLSERMKADIVAHHAEGMTYEELGAAYNVSRSTIMRIIKDRPEFAQKCENFKKEAENNALKSMDEFVKSRQEEVQRLLGKILGSLASVDYDEESVRDRVGAIKILREAFVPKAPITDESEDKALRDLANALDKIADEK